MGLEKPSASSRISRAICMHTGWLEVASTPEGGVPTALPSLMDYPHAPWWRAADAEPPAGLNPTAAIAGLLLGHGVDHPWVERAAAFCWRAIEGSETAEFHDLMPMIEFLEHAPDRPRAEAELERIRGRITAQGLAAMEVDAEGYVHKPLEWAPAPSSPCRRLFSDEVMARHLQALSDSQQEDGGWPIFWPPLSVAAEQEWRGVMTLRALKTLQAYGFLGGRA